MKEYAFIIAGSVLLAFSIQIFFQPHHLVMGGVTGIAIIMQSFFEIPIWLVNVLLNIPLFLVSFKVFGGKHLLKTLLATISLSVALYIVSYIPPVKIDDLILVSLFGGVMAGAGLGLVFRCSATTGGTDMAASLLHLKLRHLSVAKIMFVIDGIIISIGLFIFGAETAMYAIIAVFVTSKVIDAILEGLKFAKVAWIISEQSDQIAKIILKKLNRGVTGLSATGMYTGQPRNVLMIVAGRKEIVNLKALVYEVDHHAFVIVADVREVLGEGFENIS